MDLLKALRRTTFLSAAAVLALGVTEACAADDTAVIGHIQCSVASALAVAEVAPMSFGNFLPAAGTGSLVLSVDGALTVAGASMTPLYGAQQTGYLTGAQETASQEPGFFSIVTDTQTKVYVTFADNSGNIIDAQHPSNHVTMSGPDGAGAVATLYVDSFTVKRDDYAAGPPPTGTGYGGTASATDAYGTYITVDGGLTVDHFRVGATLHDTAGSLAKGQYVGTYYVMVSY